MMRNPFSSLHLMKAMSQLRTSLVLTTINANIKVLFQHTFTLTFLILFGNQMILLIAIELSYSTKRKLAEGGK